MKFLWKKKKVLGIILALVFLSLSFKDVRLEDIKTLSTRLNLYYIIPSFLLGLLMLSLRAMRWRTIIESAKKVPILTAIPLYATGQGLNIAMPALTGQVARLLLFSRKIGLSKTLIFSTLLVETLFDGMLLTSFIILASLWFVFPEEYRSFSQVIGLGALTLFALLYIQIAFRKQIDELAYKHLRHRWRGAYITIRKFSRSFSKGVAALKSTKHFMRSFALSVAIWVSHALMIFALFEAFGFDLPITAAIVVLVINTLALLVPITPGNAGTFEFVVIATLSGFSVAKTDAALFAVSLHILDFLPIMLLGAMFLRAERISISSLQEEGEKESLLDMVDESTPARQGTTP